MILLVEVQLDPHCISQSTLRQSPAGSCLKPDELAHRHPGCVVVLHVTCTTPWNALTFTSVVGLTSSSSSRYSTSSMCPLLAAI